jgi:hypothetical protein
MAEQPIYKANELDKERIHELILIIQYLHTSVASAEVNSVQFLAELNDPNPIYLVDINMEDLFRKSSKFNDWLAISKLGFEKKLDKLIQSVDNYLTSPEQDLLTNRAPKEEFAVLQDVLRMIIFASQSYLFSNADLD